MAVLLPALQKLTAFSTCTPVIRASSFKLLEEEERFETRLKGSECRRSDMRIEYSG